MADDLLAPNPEGAWPPDPQSPHPAWILCGCCDDYLCTIHAGEHAYDCECPALEDWACDPYSAGGSPLDGGSAATVDEVLTETTAWTEPEPC